MKTDIRSLVFIKNLFKDKYNIEIEWCKDDYSRYDGTFTWNNIAYIIEVKRRRFKSDKYPTTIINRDKFDILSKCNSILVIIFDDGVYIYKDVKRAFIKDSMKYGRSTTDFGGEYKYSLKTELSLKKAIKLEIDTTFSNYIRNDDI